MRAVHDVEAVRAAEKSLMALVPDGTLMHRAAAALARRCAALLPRVYGGRVVLLVGKGDNGGDALYAGAGLAQRGARVDALLVGDTAHTGGLTALTRAGGRARHAGADEDAAGIGAADIVVDGILGIGGSGGLRPDAARLAALARDSDAVTVAVDVPSGVDASTGVVAGDAIDAHVTVTFGALKPGLVISPGAHHAGAVEYVDIGLGPHLPRPSLTATDADDVAQLLPALTGRREATKYTRGVVGVVAGGPQYTGAAMLATGTAARAGAGMVRYVGPRHPAELVRARWPEVVVTECEPGDGEAVRRAGRVQAWVVGPGLGTDAAAVRMLEAVLRTDVPVLVDADGLNILADGRHALVINRPAPVVLTPHAGELARLLNVRRDEVESRRLEHARAAAHALGAVVLLKGSTTLIAEPDGTTRVSLTGGTELATAGSGDVLSGAIGALLAGGLSARDAATCGAFLHGVAGALAAGDPPAPIVADDVVSRWPHAVRAVLFDPQTPPPTHVG